MKACRAGMSKAIAAPSSAARTRMCHGWTFPDQTSAANAKARSIMAIWVQQMTTRLGWRSATEPPHIESSSMGSDPTAATVPSSTFDPVNWYTSHPWAVFCIHDPISDTS